MPSTGVFELLFLVVKLCAFFSPHPQWPFLLLFCEGGLQVGPAKWAELLAKSACDVDTPCTSLNLNPDDS